MTEGLLDCFNCGRSNPEWAHVCRACGVVLRQGNAAIVPTGRIPTDRTSLMSIGAVVGSILVAAILGVVASRVNPVDPTVGRAVASPTASETPEPTRRPVTPRPTPSETVAPSPSETAALGTLAFGTRLDGDAIAAEEDTFQRGMTFAHAITLTEPFGVSSVGEQVVRVAEDGTEEEVERAIDNQLSVVPDATAAGFEAPADTLIDAYGPGEYILRVYAGETLLAEGRFTLSDG